MVSTVYAAIRLKVIKMTSQGYTVPDTSAENSHILWSFDPISYLGANYKCSSVMV